MTARPGFLAKEMPVRIAEVAGERISVLRDTGSSTVIVRRSLIRKDEFTGANSFVCLIDGTVRRPPEPN